MTPTQRILLSRKTLALYERNGVPGGPVESTMAMIRDEADALDGIAGAEPRRADTLGKLTERWRRFADGVRMGAN